MIRNKQTERRTKDVQQKTNKQTNKQQNTHLMDVDAEHPVVLPEAAQDEGLLVLRPARRRTAAAPLPAVERAPDLVQER